MARQIVLLLCRSALQIACLMFPLVLQGQVLIRIGSAKVEVRAKEAVVPVTIINENNELGGVQIEIRQPLSTLQLTDVKAVGRADDFTVQFSTTVDARYRILLFSATGKNIRAGSGTVMELVFRLPEPRTAATLPLLAGLTTVSDQVGAMLHTEVESGSIAIGSIAELTVGSSNANAGDTVSLAITLEADTDISYLEFAINWPDGYLSILPAAGITTPPGAQIKFHGSDTGAGVKVETDAYSDWPLALNLVVESKTPAGAYSIILSAVQGTAGDGSSLAITANTGIINVYPGWLPPPDVLTAKPIRQNKVVLDWSEPARHIEALDYPTAYNIYRDQAIISNHDSLVLLATVMEAIPWPDSSTSAGMDYRYAVAAVYHDTLESGYTQTATVAVPDQAVLEVGSLTGTIGDDIAVPIRLKNSAAVGGVRYHLAVEPWGVLQSPVGRLTSRAPPDWVISITPKPAEQVYQIVALSPTLAVIPAGQGEIFSLLFATAGDEPVDLRLSLEMASVTDSQGVPYVHETLPGTLALAQKTTRVRLGTGAPTAPGDTGIVTVYLDNPQPVAAIRFTLTATPPHLAIVEAFPSERLPTDNRILTSVPGANSVNVVVSSLTNTPIPAGMGSVVSLAFKVAGAATSELVELQLTDVALTDRRGRVLPVTTTPAAFPVGEIQAVFTPASGSGEPGRTVTLPLNLSSRVDLCGFEVAVEYDTGLGHFLWADVAGRVARQQGLAITEDHKGTVVLGYTGDPLQAAAGPVANLVFRMSGDAPRGAVMPLQAMIVDIEGCTGAPLFAVGQTGRVSVGPAEAPLRHFSSSLTPTGTAHFIKARAVTVGGRYLQPGDELAVFDTSGPIIMGAGVVKADGSVNFTARLTRELPTEQRMFFVAWVAAEDRESPPGSEARFVLGNGFWGENNGLTIIDLLQLAEKPRPVVAAAPNTLTVEYSSPGAPDSQFVITVGLPEESNLQVSVYDFMGREIVNLHDGPTGSGYHRITWDGRDRAGQSLNRGLYFYQVRTPQQTVTEKLVLLK